MTLSDIEDVLRADYGPRLTDAAESAERLSRELALAERRRRAAMTPEERRIEDLEREIDGKRRAIADAIAHLRGEPCSAEHD